MNPNDALLKFLIGKNLLSSLPSEDDLRNLQCGIIRLLDEKKLVTENTVLLKLAKEFKLSIWDPPQEFDPSKFGSLRSLVTSAFCHEHLLVPTEQTKECITVVMANPFNFEARKWLEFKTSVKLKILLGKEIDIVKLIGTMFPSSRVLPSGSNEDSGLEVIDVTEEPDSTDDKYNSSAPIVKLVNKILLNAVQLEASDIHLEQTETGMVVRLRIGGTLQEVLTVPKQLQSYVIARFKVIAKMNIADRLRPQDGRFRIKLEDRQIDIRASSIPTASGEKMVLRVLGSNLGHINITNMNIPVEIQQKVVDAVLSLGKMFLVTGPTGSGKTTTLYATINYLNDGCRNITTIEDPVEYKLNGITQIQLNERANVTFASALRSTLRQDPDVILVGEIRDAETLKVALQAAQTGHLVLATLHTNDAPSAIDRLIDMGADPQLLASSLTGVLAQRLVRKNCDKCSRLMTKDEWRAYQQYISHYNISTDILKIGQGCVDCNFLGYKGRIGVYSYLQITHLLRDGINRSSDQLQLIELAKEDGFYNLDEAAIESVKNGVTSIAEVRPYLNLDKPVVKKVTQKISEEQISEKIADIPKKMNKDDKLRKNLVLIVDDNKEARKFMRALLQKEMVDIVEAGTGLEALDKITEQVPDLILCDVQMPEMDGKELLGTLKRNPRTKTIPMIMLTIDDNQENELELLQLGALNFISKRTSPPVILGRIRGALRV
jgi:type IV pilus assembly protein PilB